MAKKLLRVVLSVEVDDLDEAARADYGVIEGSSKDLPRLKDYRPSDLGVLFEGLNADPAILFAGSGVYAKFTDIAFVGADWVQDT